MVELAREFGVQAAFSMGLLSILGSMLWVLVRSHTRFLINLTLCFRQITTAIELMQANIKDKEGHIRLILERQEHLLRLFDRGKHQ